MILTLTPNAALDRLLFIEEFQPGTVMRPHKMLDRVGGKGLDSSVALRGLGVETVAVTFVGGQTGQALMSLLEAYGIRHDLIWLDGETRIAHVLIESRRQRHSHIITQTLAVTPEAATEFLQRYQAHLREAAWVITAGSLPPGVPGSYYRTICQMAHEAGVPILVDGTGPPVTATLPAPPTILKMNWGEFCQTFGVRAGTLDQLKKQAQVIHERERLFALVLTCGEQGLLAVTPEGTYQARSPVQPVVNAAGAGDAASAALAWRFSTGANWPETLRWAAAVSAAVVLTEGTADCRMTDIQRLLLQTKIESLA
jgi:1-phosphofructokinase family hexose kinase